MTNKVRNQDIYLKLRLRKILFSQGYWCPIEVELSHYEQTGSLFKRKPLTDLDVLAIKYDSTFVPHRVVADCKSGQTSDVARLFWLRGVTDYFGADVSYYVHTKIDSHAKAIAPKLGLRVLGDAELAFLEKTHNIDALPVPLSDVLKHELVSSLWGISIPAGKKPTTEQLKIKDVYSYLAYQYWYVDFYRNLLMLVTKYREIAHLLKDGDSRDILLVFIGAERFAHCLMEIACYVQAQGGSEIPRLVRMYLYGGALSLRDKERLFDLFKKTTGSKEKFDPEWLPEIVELIGRILKNPQGASEILRYLTMMHLCLVMEGRKDIPNISGAQHIPAVVLAKDVLMTFSKITGIPAKLFSVVDGI
jgi:hypothetical protein